MYTTRQEELNVFPRVHSFFIQGKSKVMRQNCHHQPF